MKKVWNQWWGGEGAGGKEGKGPEVVVVVAEKDGRSK